MRRLLPLCAVLGLLGAAGAPAAGCDRQSNNVRQVSCVGQHGADPLDCNVTAHDGTTDRGRLRLSSPDATLLAQMLGGAPRLVRELKLTDSDLSVLSDGTLVGLASPQILNLRRNRLSAVPAAALARLPRLRSLSISDNPIRQLRGHQLLAVPCLQHLSLAYNGLQRLEAAALPTRLRHLGLGFNQLHSLNGTLRNLTSLTWLMVTKNRLTSLRAQLPLGGKLTMLLASDNRLTSVEGLQDAPQLTVLNLASNQLSSAGSLRLPRLETLNLSNNQIRRVSVAQLNGLPALKELTLDGNQLTELGAILTVLPALTNLSLSHNQLSSIAELLPADQQETTASHPLRVMSAVGNRITTLGRLHLPKLRKLNLSGNQLTQVTAANLAGLRSLEVLVLSGNRLRRLGQVLEVLPALTRADFSDNQLSTVMPLSPPEQLPHESKPQLLSLQTLLLNNNSLSLLYVSLYRLPALCVLDVRNNAVSRLRWYQHPAWRCRLQHRKLRASGNPVRCEDQEMRLSLKQAALNFTLDVPLCGGGR